MTPPSGARLAPSAAPSNHLKLWTDGRALYVEIPGAVLSFQLSEGGLSKALSLIRTQRYDFGGTIQPKGKPQAHAQAESILRQRGIIR